MSRQEILEQVLNMVAMSYKKDVVGLSEKTSFKEDLGGASVQMVALVSEIENELDVALMLVDASACNTISDLVDLIEEEM
ncbi:acyl carrier protein [Ruminococcus hominis]|uniref:Acyl carrier protein n=1 Tax=Ruminococcus hominis TaxID=2763065 RepID=A0ABR7G669_9FIRM|nr:acyl carrier protein [Ruminococcus hominis]MBC5682918.1 acyl carrier protein [Ruminococcus hominis]